MSPFHFTAQLEKSPRARFVGSSENPGGQVKFIYSEKATKFCEIFNLLLSYVVPVKSKVKILETFRGQ